MTAILTRRSGSRVRKVRKSLTTWIYLELQVCTGRYKTSSWGAVYELCTYADRILKILDPLYNISICSSIDIWSPPTCLSTQFMNGPKWFIEFLWFSKFSNLSRNYISVSISFQYFLNSFGCKKYYSMRIRKYIEHSTMLRIFLVNCTETHEILLDLTRMFQKRGSRVTDITVWFIFLFSKSSITMGLLCEE